MTDFFPLQKLSVSEVLWFHVWQQIVTRVRTFTRCESIVNYVCISLFQTTQHCASKAQRFWERSDSVVSGIFRCIRDTGVVIEEDMDEASTRGY